MRSLVKLRIDEFETSYLVKYLVAQPLPRIIAHKKENGSMNRTLKA